MNGIFFFMFSISLTYMYMYFGVYYICWSIFVGIIVCKSLIPNGVISA